MIDAIYDDDVIAGANAQNLIEACNSGLCSNIPPGIYYTGVPSVDELLSQLGLRECSHMTEEQWFQACDILDPVDINQESKRR